MKNSGVVSSAQALDDYFDALLDEDFVSQEQDNVANENALSLERAFMPTPLAMSILSTDIFNTTLTKEERDLTAVEKLLSELKLDEGVVVEMLTDTSVTTDVVTELNAEVTAQTHIETISSPVLDSVEIEPCTVVAPDVDVIALNHDEVNQEIEVSDEAEVATSLKEKAPREWINIEAEYPFQVLFFESVGVIYAVPLAELGGIHRLVSCNHLIGRPDWYLGLQIEQKKQLDVVDTGKWVMPEKIADNRHRDDYSYIVMLGNSKWGLACNALLGTELLSKEAVKWREQAGKRPWLAGLVKQRMCALIHVETLIAMLNQGINASELAKLT